MRLLNVSIYQKVHHQIFRNKRHLTKDISKNASRTLDFLSNVNEMKYKSKKLPKNRRSPEAIQVQLDMSHMRVFHPSLPSQLHGVTTVLFTDDTTLFVVGQSPAVISAALTNALASAYEWLLTSGLQLNTAKTKRMLIHSSRWKSNSTLEVRLNDQCLEQVTKYKFLGVTINDTLTWDDHISQICTKATRGINLLCRIVWFLSRDVLCCYYNAYILPSFTYADSVWCTCTSAQSNRLERLQNYPARIILHGQRKTSATSMRHELGWPTLASANL